MIKEITGDIFEEFEAGRINVILHQANCFHTMGGGIAAVIAKKYPIALAEDKRSLLGDKEKLGRFSLARLDDGRKIVNIYSQFDTSAMKNTEDDIRDYIEEEMAEAGRATRYDAIDVAFRKIEKIIRGSENSGKYVVGIPYGYGSDLAGGSWTIVRAIIESVFGESPIKVIIVKLPTAKKLK